MPPSYDSQALASGWIGPEIGFDLLCNCIHPGQRVLDIGIGTGLASVPLRNAGLIVSGMDSSEEMLAVCRAKGLADLALHDLTKLPYPYAGGSFDVVICMGVLQFFEDLSPVFAESGRLLHERGFFVFTVSDREKDQPRSCIVEPELTQLGVAVTMYRHDAAQIGALCTEHGLALLRSVAFDVFMDRERTRRLPSRAYLAQRAG